MSSRITIIIPTFERPEFLRRSLDYWSVYPVNVIVIDGSIAPALAIDRFLLPTNVQYYHLPISLEERFSFAATMLVGTYAALISDDEFLAYSALDLAANILDAESEVSAVLGATLAFNNLHGRFLCKMQYQSAQQLNINGSTPRERLEQRFNATGNSIFYPLVRVEALRLALQFIGEHKYSCPYIAEYQMEAMLCAAGAVRVMPIVMWFRSFETPMITSTNHDRGVLLPVWIQDRRNLGDLERLKTSASKYFSMASSSSNKITGERFVELYTQPSPLAKQEMVISKIMRLYSLLPVYLKGMIRSLFYSMRGGFDYIFPGRLAGFKTTAEVLNDFQALNIEFDRQAINRVQDIVLRYRPVKIDNL